MRYRPLDVDSLVLAAQKPSRYVGGEVNSIAKDLRSMKATWALCFPDTYEVGMSNLGFRLLYHVLNARPDVACERAFMPWPDMASLQREKKIPLWALESRAALRDFDIIGFSLQFEACYTTCLEMLDLAGVPVLSKDRKESDPLVVAGGPCTMNGEPVAPFFDAMVIGDGEEVVHEISSVVIDWKRSSGTRKELLEALAKIPGVYIPSFFDIRYKSDDNTILEIVPLHTGYQKVRRRIVSNLDNVLSIEKPVMPFMQAVHDRLPLEIQRGCVRGCRFCQAGMTTRPVRQRNPAEVLKAAERGLANTGWEEVGFLSLSAGDYGCINQMLEAFFDRFSASRIAISLPSLRTETMTPALAKQIAQVKKTGFTIAPEAATERLRRGINKGNSEENLLGAVDSVFRAGWRLVKLYFMIGLPSEEDEDVLAIASLAKKALRVSKASRSDAQINIAVSTFVPKPFTPFQWEPMIGLEETMRKHDLIRGALPRKGSINYKYHEAKGSMVEAALARGDRRVASAVLSAWRSGQILDGWTEHFSFERWESAFGDMEKEHGVSARFFANRERGQDEVLPWDMIDVGVSKDFLLSDRLKSKAFEPLQDCISGSCKACGVCDGVVGVTNRIYEPKDFASELNTRSGADQASSPVGSPSRVESELANEGFVKSHLSALDWQSQPSLTSSGLSPQTPEPECFAKRSIANDLAGLDPTETGQCRPAENSPAGNVTGETQAEPSICSEEARPRYFVRLKYAKKGRAMALSHLETMNTILRALRRSGLPIAYTQGFNPHPRVSFGPACPVGVQSLAEYCDVELTAPVEARSVSEAMAAQMPLLLPLLEAEAISSRATALAISIAWLKYGVRFAETVSDEEISLRVAAFAAAEKLEVVRQTVRKQLARDRKFGRPSEKTSCKARIIDLKTAVRELVSGGPGYVVFTLRAGNEASAKPSEVVQKIFGGLEVSEVIKETAIFMPSEKT